MPNIRREGPPLIGWIGHVRLSPKGDFIAFLDYPIQGDDSGSLAVVDLSGKKKTLSEGWYSSQGLAWSRGCLSH
jgi:eukaryotic-like serine/threonine-protein kinase